MFLKVMVNKLLPTGKKKKNHPVFSNQGGLKGYETISNAQML